MDDQTTTQTPGMPGGTPQAPAPEPQAPTMDTPGVGSSTPPTPEPQAPTMPEMPTPGTGDTSGGATTPPTGV